MQEPMSPDHARILVSWMGTDVGQRFIHHLEELGSQYIGGLINGEGNELYRCQGRQQCLASIVGYFNEAERIVERENAAQIPQPDRQVSDLPAPWGASLDVYDLEGID